jgi:hypothetical protein
MKSFIYEVGMPDKTFNACVLAHCSDTAKHAITHQFPQAGYISYKMFCEVILQNQEQVVINEATPPREQNS